MSCHVRFARPFALAVCLLAAAALAEAARVSGTVIDPQGRPVAGARVQLDGPVGAARETRTAGDGTYTFDAVAEGTFLARAFADGFQADPVPVTVTSPDADLHETLALRLSAVTDTIVVSASSLEAPLSTLPASTTVLGADDLRVAQAETLADALRHVPGMGVSASGGRGRGHVALPARRRVRLHAGAGRRLRLNSFGGGFDVAHLSAAGIERVEVVRGPQSALFGADAIGGVVQLVTRRGGPLARSAPGSKAAAPRRAAPPPTPAADPARGRGAAAAEQDDPARLQRRRRTTAGERVANDDYAARQLTAELAGGARRAASSGASRDAASTERGYPGPFGCDPNGTYAGIDTVSRGTTDHVRGAVSVAPSIGSAIRVRANADAGRPRQPATAARGELDVHRDASRAGRVQADWTAAARVGLQRPAPKLLRERARNTYITGLDGRRRCRSSARVDGRLRRGALRGRRARCSSTAGLRAGAHPRDALAGATRRLLAAAGASGATRWSRRTRALRRAGSPRPMPTGSGAGRGSDANAGTGIRPPDAFEIAFTDNPALKPERSRSVDVGVEQALLGGRLVADATWFANRYDDLIVAVGPALPDASRYPHRQHRQRARARPRARPARCGRLAAWLACAAGYTLLDTEVLAVDGGSGRRPPPFARWRPADPPAAPPGLRGRHLRRRPRRRRSLRVGARGRVLDVDPSYGAFGGKLAAPGFAVADVGRRRARLAHGTRSSGA